MSFESYNILNFDFMSLINLVQRDIMSYKEVLRVTRISSTLYLHGKFPHKESKLMLLGPPDSGKTSWFSPFQGIEVFTIMFSLISIGMLLPRYFTLYVRDPRLYYYYYYYYYYY